MEIDFWAARWKEGRIGFHEGRANTFLARHVEKLKAEGAKPTNVLVPLCGKAEDLAFLAAQGFRVVGIEAIEDAVKAFFAEHELTPSIEERPHGRVYEAKGITLHAADVFACTRDALGVSSGFDALYDRAAVVALPEATRVKYVAHLRLLMAPKARGLVITFEYTSGEFAPPPFSVVESEIRALYKGVEEVAAVDQGLAEGVRFREANVGATENVYAIRF